MSDDTKTLELYDVHQGLIPRDGGPYLDELEREQAEIRRAKVEGRKPDLENPPATAGTQLVPAKYLLNMQNSNSRPSQEHVDHLGDNLHQVIENKPAATVQVTDASKFPDPNPADPTVASEGSVNEGEKSQSKSSRKPAKKAAKPAAKKATVNKPNPVTKAAQAGK